MSHILIVEGEADHAQQRVAWAFYQHQLRFFCQRRLQRLFIALIDKQYAITATFCQTVKQSIAPAVAVVRNDEAVAGAQDAVSDQLFRFVRQLLITRYFHGAGLF